MRTLVVGMFGCSTSIRSLVHMPLSHRAGLLRCSVVALTFKVWEKVMSLLSIRPFAGHSQ